MTTYRRTTAWVVTTAFLPAFATPCVRAAFSNSLALDHTLQSQEAARITARILLAPVSVSICLGSMLRALPSLLFFVGLISLSGAVLMLDASGAYGARSFGSYIFQVVFCAICAITGFAAQAASHPHCARRRPQYWLCGWALVYGTYLALRTFPGPFWHVASIVSMLSIAAAGVCLAWKHPGLFESGAKP